MLIEELIEILQTCNPKHKIYIEADNEDCDEINFIQIDDIREYILICSCADENELRIVKLC